MHNTNTHTHTHTRQQHFKNIITSVVVVVVVVPRKCKDICISPEHLDELWGPPSLHSMGTGFLHEAKSANLEAKLS
jgi:hypothetical protein